VCGRLPGGEAELTVKPFEHAALAGSIGHLPGAERASSKAMQQPEGAGMRPVDGFDRML